MWVIKKLFSFVVTACCITVVGGLVWANNLCKLKDIDGVRTFYLYAASSQAKMVSTLRFEDLFSVKGESVRFDRNGQDEYGLVSEILAQYGATLTYTETLDGVTSYYAITPNLYGGVLINGNKINLHIAISENQCVVGTPVIFGGF